MFPLEVHPPMSPWVIALTFLRSTFQGMDADFFLRYGVVALMEQFASATPALPLSYCSY